VDQQDSRSLELLLPAALRELRAAAGRPAISWLARQAGSSEATVSDALSGRRRPSRHVLEAVVVALGADPVPWGGQWDELDQARREARPKVGRFDAAGVKVCEVEGCPTKPGRRWCQKHEVYNRRFGSPTAGTFLSGKQSETCSVDGCDGAFYALGLCKRHYSRIERRRHRERSQREGRVGLTGKQ
jgi:hypothetical protein